MYAQDEHEDAAEAALKLSILLVSFATGGLCHGWLWGGFVKC